MSKRREVKRSDTAGAVFSLVIGFALGVVGVQGLVTGRYAFTPPAVYLALSAVLIVIGVAQLAWVRRRKRRDQ